MFTQRNSSWDSEYSLTIAEPHRPDDGFQYLNWGSNIAPESGDVLPRLPPWAIADALRRLPEEELKLALRLKILPTVTLPGIKLFAAFGSAAVRIAERDKLPLMAVGAPADFIAASRSALGAELLNEAANGLARRNPSRSASRRISGAQAVIFWTMMVATMSSAFLVPGAAFLSVAGVIGGLSFLAMIALRLLCLMPPVKRGRLWSLPLQDAELPVYSILVPLFRETSVLNQLLAGLVSLDYPREKLDIKLILEESDILMQRAVFGLPLPEHFDVIVVPSGLPQTKPRALNYALQFARGDLVTIFDAEDIPEPDQLRRAAEAFDASPRQVACLQAALIFYNPNENWLTRQFTIEYASLFNVMLPALAASRLPFPLGGTSNHFRADILRAIGAWDPHNVTEDADIGLRLARAGYETATLASGTYEEANTQLLNWMRQRSRWLKGFLQTWLVHMRHPVDFFREVGPSGFWVAQAMTIGVFLSALLHPICLATLALPLLLGVPLDGNTGMLAIVLAGLNLAVLVSGYAVAMVMGVRGLRRVHIDGWWFSIATMPFYWLLMSVAAWMALWQFVTAPSYWNKTQHGLSVFQRRRRAARR